MKLLILFAFCLSATYGQVIPDPEAPAAFLPMYIVGAGLSYGNPGFAGAVDIDVHASGRFYFHTVLGNIATTGGRVTTVIRPGTEFRFWQSVSGNMTLVAEGDAGFTVGATSTLSQFTGGGYAAWDACHAVKVLNRLGHCFLELGASIVGGSSISSLPAAGQAVQLVPRLQVRFGAK